MCASLISTVSSAYSILIPSGLLRDAEKQFLSSVKIASMIGPNLELAKVYLRMDQPQSAIEAYKSALKKHAGEVKILRQEHAPCFGDEKKKRRSLQIKATPVAPVCVFLYLPMHMFSLMDLEAHATSAGSLFCSPLAPLVLPLVSLRPAFIR